MGTTEPMVSTVVVRRFLEAIEQAGVPRARVLREWGRDDRSLQGPDGLVPHTAVDRLCELAVELTGDPALGLHWAAAVTQRTFAPLSYLLAHADSLRHALELLAQCQCVFSERPFHTVIETEHAAIVRVVDWTDCSDTVVRFAAEMVMAGFLTMFRVLIPGVKPLSVSFAYQAPAYCGEYSRVFGTGVQFDRPHTELAIERTLLDAPSPDADADLRVAAQTVIDRRLLSTRRFAPYSVRVRALIAQHIPRRISMTDVARAFGMSSRSLRRALAEEGTKYREIECLELRTVAERLLLDEQLSVRETASKLGFSDATAFHRAFKRWKGVTPSTFRDR